MTTETSHAREDFRTSQSPRSRGLETNTSGETEANVTVNRMNAREVHDLFGDLDLRNHSTNSTMHRRQSPLLTTSPLLPHMLYRSSSGRLKGLGCSTRSRRTASSKRNSTAKSIKSDDGMKLNGTDDFIYHLPKGGTIVMTEIGPIQFGIPPETIKDSLELSLEVPQYYVVPSERFCCKIGAQQGLNLAEFEFPAYFNFFMRQGRKIVLIVDNDNVKGCIQKVFQETLLGPEEWDPNVDFSPSYPVEKKPNMLKETAYFQKFGRHQLSVDLLLDFAVFGPNHQNVVLQSTTDPAKMVSIFRNLDEYFLYDSKNQLICSVPTEIKVPVRRYFFPKTFKHVAKKLKPICFTPPAFGVTVLGSSHGFDPKGKTSGYVLWMNHRGLMIDPPPNSTHLLQKNYIPPCLIDAVVVTHCHADHDAGTFQKILQEGKVTLITTPTIMGCFLRKYSALAGFDIEFLQTVFKFKPVKIGQGLSFHGGKLSFFYTLHSIPCVGFEAFYGQRSIVFSADHMNDPKKINQLYEQGVLTKGRRDDLLRFPWHHDLILHEAGVPPIHTPIDTLVALDDETKKRLYVVHTSHNSIPKNSGLRIAKPGVENTIVIQGVVPPNYSQELQKIDLVTGIEMFSDLKLCHASEIFTSAEVVKFKEGEPIVTRGEAADSFYIIEAGIAEVRVDRTRSLGYVFDDAEIHNENYDILVTTACPSPRPRAKSETLTGSSTPANSSDEEEKVPEQKKSLRKSGSLIQTARKFSQKTHLRYSTHKRSFAQRTKSRSQVTSSLEMNVNAGNFTLRTFYAGDYFGENALITDDSIRTATIMALTHLTAIKFEKYSFLSILEDTGILTKLRHLAAMRNQGSWETIESNSMLRDLTPAQKTQLETYFFQKDYRHDDIIWNENDPCEFAVLLHTGQVSYTQSMTMYKRRGSGVHVDVSILYDEIRGESSFTSNNSSSSSRQKTRRNYSVPEITSSREYSALLRSSVTRESSVDDSVDMSSSMLNGGGTFTHLHRNDPDLAAALGKEVNEGIFKRNEQLENDLSALKLSDKVSQRSFVFKRGAFIGDVDGLFYDGSNKASLRAIGEVSVLCLLKADLQKFFKNNPGVLLSMMHTQFII